jgi:hypothetical protein
MTMIMAKRTALEAKLKPTSYPAGAHVIQQGDVASAMYVIASGVAEVGNEDLTVMYGVKQEGMQAVAPAPPPHLRNTLFLPISFCAIFARGGLTIALAPRVCMRNLRRVFRRVGSHYQRPPQCHSPGKPCRSP